MEKERVLVWVADMEMRIRLVNIINRSGKYQAIEYKYGVDDIESIYAQAPQIMLLDVDEAAINPEIIVKNLRQRVAGISIIGLRHRWDALARDRYADVFDAVLVMPFDVESFTRSVEEAESRHNVADCDVLTFFAPKGKSGRTTLIVNLAMALARESGAKVGIIDAETNFADMETFLNLNPESTIIEALRDLNYLTPKTLNKYFEDVSDNVKVLCGAKSTKNACQITPEGLNLLIELARKCFRYILIDIAPGFTPVTVAACEASEHVYVTTMADGTFDIKHVEKALDIFHSLDAWEKRVETIITRVKLDANYRRNLEEKLGCPVTLIPNEYILCSQAANNGRMALDIGPSSSLTQQIDLLAKKIVG